MSKNPQKEPSSRTTVSDTKSNSASKTKKMDIDAYRKIEREQYRKSLDQLSMELSEISDTNEYLDKLASFVLSKADSKNSENIQSAQKLISGHATSAPAEPAVEISWAGDEHQVLDDQLDRSMAICRSLLFTLSKLRAKRDELKSYVEEVTPLVKKLNAIQNVDYSAITISADREKAVYHSKEDGQISAKFDIENRNIRTLETRETFQRPPNEDRIVDLAESIRKNGWIKPVTVRDGKVLDGAHRVQAASRLGLTDIPVVDVSNPIAIWRLQAHEISLKIEELNIKHAKRFLMIGQSQNSPWVLNTENRAKELDTTATGTTEESHQSLQVNNSTSAVEEHMDVSDPESLLPQEAKADITINVGGKPVTLYYKSEILEIVRDARNRGTHPSSVQTLLGERAVDLQLQLAAMSGKFPLPTIVLLLLNDGISRTAKQVAEDVFNRPKEFQWDDVIEQLRPRLARILWRHWRSGYIRKINRGRYLNTNSTAEFIKQVIEYGDIDVKDHLGYTPLHLAALEDKTEMANMLIDHGAKIDARDNMGATPLYEAIHKNSIGVARLLIEQGADVNTEDKNAWTPLHNAAWNNRPDAARLLIEQGAKIDARDNMRATPLHWAKQNHATEMANMLIDHGADINATDDKGRTTMDWASGAFTEHLRSDELFNQYVQWREKNRESSFAYDTRRRTHESGN